MITYIYLNKEDKTKLNKLAQSKQLSLSTTADIIYKFYFYPASLRKTYINKGNIKTCIKIRNAQAQPVNCMFITNAIYMYLHNEVINQYWTKEHLNKINRKIQSQLDKTYDANFNKNLIIREMYRAKSQLGIGKQC